MVRPTAAQRQARIAADRASKSRDMQPGESIRMRENKSRSIAPSFRMSSSEEQGPIDAAAEYSERALAARVKQGLPPVVQDRTVLSKVSAMMAETLGKAADASHDDEVA
jgi:hypothetical protein